jgi:hypothetical protein
MIGLGSQLQEIFGGREAVSTISKWRRRWLGPKRAPARGIAVLGTPRFEDPDSLQELLSRHDEVLQWAAERNLALSDEPEGLMELDGALDKRAVAPVIGHELGNELGLYLGTVIVKNVEGARWCVWPNGHPIVRLVSGQDLDVTALVDQRLRGKGMSLPDVYLKALRN